ncbi:Peptide transport system permease protein sapC [Methylophaga frappieri]|uniref:Peptide transport system permease protein sapC n=1 Tax=Methylophaga frappieri (strain ATCC BAA-2434 / DSM 25690 / JAM7) TaxID=754477 RepID=I1YKK3_METFJ|nr:SapC family protein [Methylophaga frappieri]AFJ03446.1 Peptide transport system permease protein sapC [Methylophaga frappieri]
MTESKQPHVFAIDSQQHAKAGWQPRHGFEFAKTFHISPIVADELAHVMATMPVAFMPIKQGESSRWLMVAVLSPVPGKNDFLHPNGRWLGGYLPATFRTYPFKMIHTPEGKRVLGFDSRSDRFVAQAESGDQRFFDDNGALTPQTEKIVRFLEVYESSRDVTEKAITALADAGILKPWRTMLKNPEENPDYLKELFIVDDKKLKALAPDTLAALAKSGALGVAYGQLLSLPRLSVFRKLTELHNEIAKQQQPAAVDEVDLDALFGEDGDDTFKFD